MAESVVVGDKVGHSDNGVNGKASDKKESLKVVLLQIKWIN